MSNWETVVNKKKGHVNKGDVQRAKKKFLTGDSVPKLEKNDPIKLDKTAFAPGDGSDKENYPSRIQYKENEEKKSPRNIVRKKDKPKPKPTAVDLSAEVKNISVDGLRGTIKSVKEKFANHPVIWLKEVASWMKLEMKAQSDKTDLALLKHPEGFPASSLSGSIRDLLVGLMRKCDQKSLGTFYISLIAGMTADIQQGNSFLVDRILIQLLCEVEPSVIADNFNEIIAGKSKNADSYVAVMWALIQPVGKLGKRLEVWWSSMFSVLDKKRHAVAAVHFLKEILQVLKPTKISSSQLTSHQFLQMYDVVFGNKSPLLHTPSLIDDLKGFAPLFKRMLLTDNPEKQSMKVFQELLDELKNKDESVERNMICEVLIDCLAANPECMKWWSENIQVHLKQSSVLLKFIKDNEVEVQLKLGKQRCYGQLHPLVLASQTMLSKMEKANERGRFEKKPGFRECKKICTYFMQAEMKRRQQSSSLFRMLKFIVLMSIIFVSVDVYTNKGYTGSKTSVFFKKYGLEDKLIIGYNFADQKRVEVTRYVTTNAPIYYAKVSPYVDPVIEKTGYYTRVAMEAIYKHSKPVRDFANTHIPPLLEKLAYFLRRQYEIISAFFVALYNKYAPIVQSSITDAYQWLEVAVPKAYHFTVTNLLLLKKTIYELNPAMFDKVYVILCDAFNYVVKMVPIVVERCMVALNVLLETLRSYFAQSQQWMQQQFKNASPTGAK